VVSQARLHKFKHDLHVYGTSGTRQVVIDLNPATLKTSWFISTLLVILPAAELQAVIATAISDEGGSLLHHF